MPHEILLYECGCCGQYHRAGYTGDCRNDAERFTSDEDFTTRTGQPAREVWLDEQQDDEQHHNTSRS